MKTEWTPFQEKAIKTTGTNLLVSAAAGSGKTAVLAARCAYLVCDAPDPCDVTELLVVTFTNAAAEEMRQRIGLAIRQRAAETHDPRLQRQSLLINAAQISTIHSFGQSIVRRHFHELGIDPGFRLLDEDEAKQLRADLVENLLDRRFDDEKAVDFRKLVDLYANGRPKTIASLILGLYDKLVSIIDAKSWLADRRAALVEASTMPMQQSRIGQAVRQQLADQIVVFASAAKRLGLAIAAVPALTKYVAHVGTIQAKLDGWVTAFKTGSWDAIAADIAGWKPEKLPNVAASKDKELMQARINVLKKDIKKITEDPLFRFTEKQLRESVQQSLWATDLIVELVQQFADDYALAKRDASAMDFGDLEHLALKVLQEPGSKPPAPSKIAIEYQQQFRHVMVDEYQDVNQVQDTILSLVGRRDNHFAVGDVKQSIYRFRQADPQRFIDRYKRYAKDELGSGQVIDLQNNFRSRAPLLEVLNGIFEVLMTRESAEVAYSKSQRLEPGTTFPTDKGLFNGKPIELHILEKRKAAAGSDSDEDCDEDFASDEREALLAAMRIRSLLGLDGSARAQVTLRDQSTRPIEPRDIVILLRAMRIKAEHFAGILRRAGVPVQADSTSGFFAATEVGDVLSVLKLLINHRDDLALAAFLRSPLSGWSDIEDKLAEIRLAFPMRDAACFHQAYAKYARRSGPLADLIDTTDKQLDHWRAMAQNKPVGDVVWAILQDTAYLTYVAGLPDGPQRVANLLHLHQRAKQFETFQRPTLARFIDFLARIEDENDLGMPAASGVASNAVRIMSIHKSKGLEFPVVILPDLGKQHNLRDTRGQLMFDDSVGIAARMVDTTKEVHFATLATTLASSEIHRKQIAEELRVLYVAGTRAKEHLILIGTTSEDPVTAWDAVWAGHVGEMNYGQVRAGKTMLDWIGPACSMVEYRAPGSVVRTFHTEQAIHSEGKAILQKQSQQTLDPDVIAMKPVSYGSMQDATVGVVISRLQQVYPHQPVTRTPAVTSVTTSTKSGKTAPGGKAASLADVVRFDPTLKLPRNVAGASSITPADIGTITHEVLQRLELASVSDRASLDIAIRRLVDQRLIRNDLVQYVDRDAIAWFLLDTPLGCQLRSSPDVRCELPITYATRVDEGDASDQQMVRGRIDALLVEDDGLTLIDYKTDRVTGDTIAKRVAFYQGQIDAYRDNIARLTHRKIKAAYLVFLTARTIQAV